MDDRYTQLEQGVPVAGLLGYLNFSDGRPDPRWQRQLNDAYAFLDSHQVERPWLALHAWLAARLPGLRDSGAAAFRDARQAEQVLDLYSRVLPAYRAYHADLLGHLDDAEVFQPYFLARVFETILAVRSANGTDDPVAAVLGRLNDYVGHRPVALLETRPQGEPYPHERHRPLPLFIRGPGVAIGRYHDLLARALDLLAAADPALLAEAHFDPKALDEFAIDLRAFDHNHPANLRPNHVFGEWDPHVIDNQGRYRRFVARQVVLDGLLDRIAHPAPAEAAESDAARAARKPSPDELLTEAAAVLAGTVLMATGVSGSGPTAHDSTQTLGVLLPRIARNRDLFYEQLIRKIDGTHGERLRQEQAATRQAFGGARQHLNGYLARHRAGQLQHRYLSLLFAQMGYPEAGLAEARRIPAVSLRLLSDLLGRLRSGLTLAEHGRAREASRLLPEAEEVLHRGIACGAFVDPWNILGFQGLYPLSAAREDSARDPRVEELLQVVEQVFNLHARLTSEAAAGGDTELVEHLTARMDRLAAWWDPFATPTVSDVRRVHGGEAAASARNVARALASWHTRGEKASDLGFWRGQVEGFRSPKAFALVVDALLRKSDYRAAVGLLMSWLAQAEQVPLDDGPFSFHNLALRWMLALARPNAAGPEVTSASTEILAAFPVPPLAERRELVRKFFDQLEANADEFWQVPALDLGDGVEEEEPAGHDLYEAAYEDVTYRDSTDDGEEGAVAGDGPEPEAKSFDLQEEAGRLERRLRFLSTVARLWQVAARFLGGAADGQRDPAADESLGAWLAAAQDRQQRLLGLIDSIHSRDLPEPGGSYDTMVEYDRRRDLREQLLYGTIGTCLDMTLAVIALKGNVDRSGQAERPFSGAPWEAAALRLERALYSGQADEARAALGPFLEKFRDEPLLYAPLARGGSPRHILRVRIAQTVLRALLSNLPRLGLLRETYDLLRTARAMEQTPPPGGRGVSEFNHYFQAAFQAVVEGVIDSAAAGWPAEHATDAELVETLERLTGPFQTLWIEHSWTGQLSVLESIGGEAEWLALRSFVQRYGRDLFHARFMTLANLRAILHRGVGAYLDYLRDTPDPLRPVRLLDDLGREIRREDAVRRMELVLQAVVENYEEFKDYNTTTPQSDYGENLCVLLDFLRQKVLYERNAWEFRPRVLAHEVLARRGRTTAAVLWEQALMRRSRDLARQHLEQLTSLEQSRGLRLKTVRDRLGERFVKPLALDRLCALIEPAMLEASRGGPTPSFARLEQELQTFAATPAGVGRDVPDWLRRLEMEVHRAQAAHTTIAVLAESFFRVPRRPLSYEELQRQLRGWDRPALPQ